MFSQDKIEKLEAELQSLQDMIASSVQHSSKTGDYLIRVKVTIQDKNAHNIAVIQPRNPSCSKLLTSQSKPVSGARLMLLLAHQSCYIFWQAEDIHCICEATFVIEKIGGRARTATVRTYQENKELKQSLVEEGEKLYS